MIFDPVAREFPRRSKTYYRTAVGFVWEGPKVYPVRNTVYSMQVCHAFMHETRASEWWEEQEKAGRGKETLD